MVEREWEEVVEREREEVVGSFFPYFPPLKPRCVLWSRVSYSLENTVVSPI